MMRLKKLFAVIFTASAVFSGLIPRAVAAEEIPANNGRILARLVDSDKVVSIKAPGGADVASTLEILNDNPAVSVAEPDYTYRIAAIPNDPGYAEQWYLENIRMAEAWNFAKGSSVVKVAILDSGVDTTHPDLKDRIWQNTAEQKNNRDDDGNGLVDDVNGWDFVDSDNDPNPAVIPDGPLEGTNHGTLVAGIIGAAGNNSEGGAGVNWSVQLMPLRVLDSNGAGSTFAVDSAIRYAIAKGAKVINISFTGRGYSRILAETMRSAQKAGIVIVAAAGNEGDTERGGNLNVYPEYPVCYRGAGNEHIIIGVSALSKSGARSSFSNYGSDCIGVSAPGESIYTTQVYRPAIKGFERPYGTGWSGSSLAAPMVAGLAALVASMHPGLGAGEIRDFIYRNAAPINHLNGIYSGHLGSGRIDAATTVTAVQQVLLAGGTIVPRAVTVPVALTRPALSDSALFGLAATVNRSPGLAVFRGNFLERSSFETFSRRSAEVPTVAMADLDGDGESDFVVGAPRGESPVIRAFNMDGAMITHFLAYEPTFRSGVRVSRIDMDGDGDDEIMATPGSGAAPRVRIFNQSGKMLAEFLAFDRNDRGGVRAAAVDVDGDGIDEIAAVSSGARNQVRIFGADGVLRFQFSPFSRAFSGGLNIAAGDTDGDGSDEIVVGAGAGGPPQVSIFSREGVARSSFLAFDNTDRKGVNLAVIEQDGSGRILAGNGPGGSVLRLMNLVGGTEKEMMPFGPRWRGGVFPAAPKLLKTLK